MDIQITKEWLKENGDKIIAIETPQYGKGFVRWINNEQIDFMVEQDDGSMKYHIMTFDYLIAHKDEVVLYYALKCKAI